MMAPVIDDPLFWLMGALAVSALGLSKGGFAGVGQIATPLMALFMPPLQAAALLLPIATAANSAVVKRTPTILFYRIAHLMVFLISLELVRAGLMGMLGW